MTSGSIQGGPGAKRMNTYLSESYKTTTDMEILSGETWVVLLIDLRIALVFSGL